MESNDIRIKNNLNLVVNRLYLYNVPIPSTIPVTPLGSFASPTKRMASGKDESVSAKFSLEFV